MSIKDQVAQEVSLFRSLWRGGYYEGDPLDPMGPSGYLSLGYMSSLHATYLACVKPYVRSNTVSLEIGPGRGAWSKCMLGAKELWCLDALSAEHNGFWEYVGRHPHVKYFQVSDFSCSMLPEGYFDYLFTFGVFCHISFEGITAYMTNLRQKLKPGAHAFVMVADYDKYAAATRAIEKLSAARVTEIRRRLRPLRSMWRWLGGDVMPKPPDKQEDQVPRPGRWYHAGIDRTCDMLSSLGFTVMDPDMGVSHRDPVIHIVR